MLKITVQNLLQSTGAIQSAYVIGLKDGSVKLTAVKMSAPLTEKLATFCASQKINSKSIFAEKSERTSNSPEIAKEMGASEIYAQLEKLAEKYVEIAKKHKDYSSNGKGGLVLYVRSK